MDTSTAHGRAMLEMAAVFARLEREMIRERVMAGLKRARDEGKRLGRPRLDYPVEKRIAKELGKGEIGIQKIAAKFGVGTGTVQRIAQRLRKAA